MSLTYRDWGEICCFREASKKKHKKKQVKLKCLWIDLVLSSRQNQDQKKQVQGSYWKLSKSSFEKVSFYIENSLSFNFLN